MKIELTTRGLLTVFFRQRRKFMVVLLVMMISGIAYVNIARPAYEASGRLLVKFGRDAGSGTIWPDQTGMVISQNDRREIMESNIEILSSHDLLLAVVHDIGAEKLYPDLAEKKTDSEEPEEVAIRRILTSDLNVKSGQQSNIISVSLLNRDPKIAAAFVHRLFELFISRQSEVYNKPQTMFLKEQVDNASAKLQKSQEALQTFKALYGISSIDDELAELLRQKSDAGTVSLQSADDAWEKLADLQAKEKQMRATYRADSPQVQRIHQSVLLAEQQLRTRQSDKGSRIGHAASKINKRIAELEAQRTQYNDLARQVKIDETNYKN